ncbi:MAG: hypothetical protein DPW22_07150 [Alphaproteobacteria bacterium]|mgnify:CR=1 FL=1|nr:hypothetical protein [Alphaproteobacteria bacterium]GIK81378.1 MAG: hypothetical protein BroJett024_24830 [Alphaproteobacteria bacterium]
MVMTTKSVRPAKSAVWCGGLLAAVAALVLAASAPAQGIDSAPRPDRVRITLVPPDNSAHAFIHWQLKSRATLERLAKFFSPLRLPRDVTMTVKGCNGEVDAYYEDAVITVCYEYLAYIHEQAPAAPRTEEGLRRRDAVVGPTIDLFLHEMAHAVFDLLKIPVFGREEDAADQFSAYLLLHADPEEARALITGTAFLSRVESQEAMSKNPELRYFAREHGHPAQRYFNLLCVAYGFDPVQFADAVSQWKLPPERARGCAQEYAQVERAFTVLIVPHLDPVLWEEVRTRKWLRNWPGQNDGRN